MAISKFCGQWPDIPETTYYDTFYPNPSVMWKRDGARMSNIAPEIGLAATTEGRGGSVGDLNLDGREDIIVANHIVHPHVYMSLQGSPVAAAALPWVRIYVSECEKGCRDSVGAIVELLRVDGIDIEDISRSKFACRIGGLT